VIGGAFVRIVAGGEQVDLPEQPAEDVPLVELEPTYLDLV
jgi:hypothetical protein